MNYYYLTDKDIIQEGDEFFISDGMGWSRCRSSIGKHICDGLQVYTTSSVKVRRLIKITKLGNSL